MRVRRLWQGLLGLGALIGALFVLVDQGGRIALWIGDSGGAPAEWAASLAYGIDPLRRHAAQAMAGADRGDAVDRSAVAVADLDRDGYATDLIVKYYGCGPTAECGPSFLVAKGIGFTHKVIGAFTQFSDMRALGGIVIGSHVQTDSPSSTLYGYQGGKLEELRAFGHLLEYGRGADQKVAVFNLIETPGGLRVRSPEGLFDILWDPAAGRYVINHLDWPAAIAGNQHVLYVRRPDGALKIDAKLMLNDRVVAGSQNARGSVTINISPLDRIVFDPACRVKDGFTEIADALGAVALDPASAQHVFECVLYPGATVTLRIGKS